MTRRRQLGPAVPCADVEGVVHALRDNLGKADAFITAAEELIGRPGGGIEDGEDDEETELGRRRNHLAHLIESARLAVRAAAYGAEEIANRRQGV